MNGGEDKEDEKAETPQDGDKTVSPASGRRLWLFFWPLLGLLLVVGVVVTLIALSRQQESEQAAPPISAETTEVPTLQTQVLASGFDHVWEIAFLPDGQLMFTQRSGTVSILQPDGSVRQIADIDDVSARGEGGLLGLAVDPNFAENRHVYTCFNSTRGPDVRVVRWTLSPDGSSLQNRNDIVTGMPSIASGRHSGCRVELGSDGYLWVATGDAAQATNAQSPTNLGGKVLRVDRNGQAAPGNLGGAFDSRIYSYGHRNSQGIAFFTEPRDGVVGISVEHGPGRDDEINLLKPGNFGWDPVPGEYNEAVPMTDTQKFPDAVPAIWSSGLPTQAPSGATMVYGPQWLAWNGALAVAFLKASHLTMFTFGPDNTIASETQVLDNFGRLRTVQQGPDGNLYIGTDNGGDDQIIKVTPVDPAVQP